MEQLTIVAFTLLILVAVWWPPVRALIALRRPQSAKSTISVLAYSLSFLVTAGGILFMWVNKVPSGIGYASFIVVGWVLFLIGFLTDPLIREFVGKKESDKNG